MSETSKRCQELVGRLVANESCPFTKENEEQLLALSEEQLEQLDEKFAEEEEVKPEPAKATESEEATRVAAKTRDEWLAEAPEEIRALVSRSEKEEKDRRDYLVACISEATDAYSKEQLEKKDLDDLMSLARAVAADVEEVSFVGKGLPRAAAAGNSFPQFFDPEVYGTKAS